MTVDADELRAHVSFEIEQCTKRINDAHGDGNLISYSFWQGELTVYKEILVWLDFQTYDRHS